MLKLSKLKKGDKLHVKHDDKELVITITHIEMEKGKASVNFTCNGDEKMHLSTELKGQKEKKRTRKLDGSNKGRGWLKGGHAIKK